MQTAEKDAAPIEVTDRDGATWTAFSGIWYRREVSGGYGDCRGTLTMLTRDFGPIAVTRVLLSGGAYEPAPPHRPPREGQRGSDGMSEHSSPQGEAWNEWATLFNDLTFALKAAEGATRFCPMMFSERRRVALALWDAGYRPTPQAVARDRERQNTRLTPSEPTP